MRLILFSVCDECNTCDVKSYGYFSVIMGLWSWFPGIVRIDLKIPMCHFDVFDIPGTLHECPPRSKSNPVIHRRQFMACGRYHRIGHVLIGLTLISLHLQLEPLCLYVYVVAIRNICKCTHVSFNPKCPKRGKMVTSPYRTSGVREIQSQSRFEQRDMGWP
jgi:hypothetical protein